MNICSEPRPGCRSWCRLLLILFLLLYRNFRSVTETMIIMLSQPFALSAGSG